MSGRIISLIISGVFLVLASAAFAEDRLVPSEYSTIQAAIDDCNNGDTVIVAPGTYTGTGNRYIDFLGKAITVKSENGPESCVIDAEWLGIIFVLYSGEEQDSVIEGFTITHGRDYESPFITWYGGGICCGSDESPTIRNCVITDNFAHFGGGIYGDNPTITNCIFTDNEASDGSAIYADANAQIINCTIARNTGGTPAVILFNGGIISNSILWDNYPNQLMVYGPNTVTYSDVQGGWPGAGNIDADPCFMDANDFHLQEGSPCVNAGDPNYTAGPDETDIDGQPRVMDMRIDMGADETGKCMATTNPDYANWVYWNKPDCWCYARQCRGDADGLKLGPFWCSGNDLTALRNCIGKLESAMPPGCECADFDHSKLGPFWVSGNDLAIVRQCVGKLEIYIPDCADPPDELFNFWLTP